MHALVAKIGKHIQTYYNNGILWKIQYGYPGMNFESTCIIAQNDQRQPLIGGQFTRPSIFWYDKNTGLRDPFLWRRPIIFFITHFWQYVGP